MRYSILFVYHSDELCSADVKLVHLRNPCTGMAARYICQHDRQQYFELMQFGDPFRSWFVNDVLTIDGSIYMTTVVDPLFLVLHYLEQECSKHFVPLENALKDNAFPAISTFTDALPLSQLLLVSFVLFSRQNKYYSFTFSFMSGL